MKVLIASSLAVLLAACGGNVDSPDDNPAPAGEDAGGDAAPEDTGAVVEDTAPVIDHGAPSTTYPAFPVDMPALTDQGFGGLKSPVLVTVTFPGDANAASYESFGDKLGATEYWKAITAEYGVGPATSGDANHVRETEAWPTSIQDYEIDAFINDHAANPTKYGWPAPTDQTIYVIYVPQGTTVSLRGQDACKSGIGGYHTSTTVATKNVAYAIVMQCAYGSKSGTPRTLTASHEIAEAATDPHPEVLDERGWVGLDTNHLAWHLFMESNVENADLCEIYREQRYSDTVDPGFTFNVARQWSNLSAKAAHNPCAPAPTSAPYFNVTALDQEDVTFNALSIGYKSKQPTKGYHVAVGETKSFAVGIWSDAATSGPISLRVGEGSPFGTTTTKRLTASIDKTSGVNGEKAIVTVTVNSVATSKASVLVVSTSDGSGTQHYMPILISSQ